MAKANCYELQLGKVLGPSLGSQQSPAVLQAGEKWLESCSCRHWNRLSKKLQSLEVFKKHEDLALEGMI